MTKPFNLSQHLARSALNLSDFAGVDPTGVADSSVAIQQAVNQALAEDRALIVGHGIFRHTQQIVVKSRRFNPNGLYAHNAFTPGLKLIGQGPLNTVFRSAVPNAYAWDFGVNVDVLFTFNGTTAVGSPVVTAVSAAVTPSVEIGAIITGVGIPAGTTVLAKAATTITLSQNATAAGTPVLTHSYYKAMKHTAIHGIGFDADQAVAGTSGWFVRSQVHFLADDCVFTGFKSDGVRVYSEDGDLDGPSYIDFHGCDFLNNGRWALDATGLPNRNEINFLRMTHCWLQDNGTTQAFVTPMTAGNEPTSGAMRWKGQSGSFRDGGFTVNKNVSLLILGGAGSAATFVADNVAFENCIDRAFLNTGCFDCNIKNSHLYSNTTYQTKVGFESLNNPNKAATFYENIRIRVSPGVVCDAFKNTSIGTTGTVKGATMLSPPIIQEFFAAGQNLIVGDWEFPCNELQCELTFAGAVVTLAPSVRGNNAVMCQRYGGSFGETGMYVDYAVRPTGFSANVAAHPNGIYNVFLYDSGNVVALEVPNPSVATATRYGQTVKSTETGKLYVGRCQVAGGVLITGAAARFLNPRWAPHLGGYHWLDSGNIQRFKATLPATDTDGTAI